MPTPVDELTVPVKFQMLTRFTGGVAVVGEEEPPQDAKEHPRASAKSARIIFS
jgi:hypothetical protein